MNELVKIDVSFEYTPQVYTYRRATSWYWKFQLPNNKWFYGRAPGKDERAVQRNARKKERELAKGLFIKKEVDKIQKSSNQLTTFEMAINEYIDHLKLENASPNYYKELKTQLIAIAKVLEDKFRVKYAHQLTEDNAYNFRKHLLKQVMNEKIKRITAFGKLNDIKRLFKWLKKRKKISQNPWVEIDAISVPKEERARTVAPEQEVLSRLMLANYKNRHEFPIKEFAYGLFRTGARKEELLFLEVDDVDWKTGHWIIRPKKCPTKHGGFWSPKYGKSRKAIIPQDVLEILKPLVERAKNHRVVGYTPNKQDKKAPVAAKFIFTMIDRSLSPKGKENIYRRVDSVRGAWNSLFIAAGLTELKKCSNGSEADTKPQSNVIIPFTRHDMRRGFNLAAKKAGISLDDRALILGHDRAVNENHYCGQAELNVREISKILNHAMNLKLGTQDISCVPN